MTLKEAVATGKRIKLGGKSFDIKCNVVLCLHEAMSDEWEVEKTEKEGWISIVPSNNSPFYRSIGSIYKTEQEAKGASPYAIATIKIEWEE